jgi:hypothetical protein
VATGTPEESIILDEIVRVYFRQKQLSFSFLVKGNISYQKAAPKRRFTTAARMGTNKRKESTAWPLTVVLEKPGVLGKVFGW